MGVRHYINKESPVKMEIGLYINKVSYSNMKIRLTLMRFPSEDHINMIDMCHKDHAWCHGVLVMT